MHSGHATRNLLSGGGFGGFAMKIVTRDRTNSSLLDQMMFVSVRLQRNQALLRLKRRVRRQACTKTPAIVARIEPLCVPGKLGLHAKPKRLPETRLIRILLVHKLKPLRPLGGPSYTICLSKMQCTITLSFSFLGRACVCTGW